MKEMECHPVQRWTTKKPTEEGMYYACERDSANVTEVYVTVPVVNGYPHRKEVLTFGGEITGEVSDYYWWKGPIAIPKPPRPRKTK